MTTAMLDAKLDAEFARVHRTRRIMQVMDRALSISEKFARVTPLTVQDRDWLNERAYYFCLRAGKLHQRAVDLLLGGSR